MSTPPRLPASTTSKNVPSHSRQSPRVKSPRRLEPLPTTHPPQESISRKRGRLTTPTTKNEKKSSIPTSRLLTVTTPTAAEKSTAGTPTTPTTPTRHRHKKTKHAPPPPSSSSSSSSPVVTTMNTIVPNAKVLRDNDKFVEAAANGDTKEVAWRLLHGQQVNCRHAYLELTALMAASRSGHRHIVMLLLEESASVDLAHRKSGHTALHYASSAGRPDVVKILLSAGANKSTRTKGGGSLTKGRLTALQVAECFQKEDVRALLRDPPCIMEVPLVTHYSKYEFGILWSAPISKGADALAHSPWWLHSSDTRRFSSSTQSSRRTERMGRCHTTSSDVNESVVKFGKEIEKSIAKKSCCKEHDCC